VTPCNPNSAQATCSTANYFGTINPKSGEIAAESVGGVAFQPKGMIYRPVMMTGCDRSSSSDERPSCSTVPGYLMRS